MTSYGFLSTYPPTQCGLATFSSALLRHLTVQGSGNTAGVVSVVDEPQPAIHPNVVAQLVNGTPTGPTVAAKALNRFDVAIVQHEYGIYGGRDGEDVLRVLAELTVPAIVVFHTVLSKPSAHQRQVLERIADAAGAVVVMSRTAARRLNEFYLVEAAKISVIPHGALGNRRLSPAASFTPFTPVTPVRARPTILTWGLIGPGKGIEWAVDALAGLDGMNPAPRYLVAGQTHPKVLEREGEAYRSSLRARAESLGVSASLDLDSSYRNTEALMALVGQADVVLLPYESTEQATSGVLIEAIAARRPIVATKFPHAEELLAGGSGLLVPQRDSKAMAHALRRVLTERGLAASMTAASARIAPGLEWSAVAASYSELADALLGVRTEVAA
jgi:glycosyltransferase involved in cell wall biosynthesis